MNWNSHFITLFWFSLFNFIKGAELDSANFSVENFSSDSALVEAGTSRISEQECSSFQNVKLMPRRKLDYRDTKAELQKFDSINNEIAEFPHRVVLGVSTAADGNVFVSGGIRWQCGGSLISNKFVLTAANCLYYKNLEWANIGNALLHTYLGLADPEQVLYKIIRRIPHPLYKSPSFYHNIGLVELDRPVEFTLYTRPACLHADQDIDPNTQLIAASWELGNFGETSETVKLQNVNLDLFTGEECERTYKDLSGSGRLSAGITHKEQFCAGQRRNNTNTCKTFSGGTLQFNVNSSSGIFYLAGVKSFGNTCGLKGVPSVYTRVAAYVSWIESVVWPQSPDQIRALQPISDEVAILTSPRLITSLSVEKCTYLQSGSVAARPTEFPHMVILGKSSEKNGSNDIIWECGGTLISEKFVLTSAFCLTKNISWANIGDEKLFTYLQLENIEQLIYKIIRQIPHPLYKDTVLYHDIALLELDRPVEFNKYARPACLHEGHDIDSPPQFLATGWGLVHKSSLWSQLRKVDLDVLTSDECEGVFKSFYGGKKIPNGILHDYQFCAGGHIGIQDTCLTGSGSPLQYKISDYTGNMWHIIGVTSSGTKCGKNGLPKIYTRLAPYVPWIESIVWPQLDPQTTQQVIHPLLIQTPVTRLTTSLSNEKCLYFREAELKERNLIFKPTAGFSGGGYGGTDAGVGEFPHMVALGFSVAGKVNEITWQCGGTLLNEKFVLTAAHCQSSNVHGNLTWALLGTTRTDAYLKPTQPHPLLRKIIRRIKHPLYKVPSKYHDIAIVELDRPVAVYTTNIRPACLSTKDELKGRFKQFIATGWGLTERGNISIDLQKIDLDLFTGDECDEAYGYWKGMRQLRSGILHTNQFCAGGRHGIQDTCLGDSGGPIQFRKSYVPAHYWQIVGITSFGKSCGLQGVPGVYTRVAPYISWIESVVWPNEYINQDKPEIIDV